jgi:hypothetical protein
LSRLGEARCSMAQHSISGVATASAVMSPSGRTHSAAGTAQQQPYAIAGSPRRGPGSATATMVTPTTSTTWATRQIDARRPRSWRRASVIAASKPRPPTST